MKIGVSAAALYKTAFVFIYVYLINGRPSVTVQDSFYSIFNTFFRVEEVF